MGRERLESDISDRLSRALKNEADTLEFGKIIASRLPKDASTILALSGDLGAGKTTFTQGLALGLGINDLVSSPTFIYLNIYEGTIPLFHFDLYRLKSLDDFEAMGFSEYFYKKGVCVIEWPERISLPENSIHFVFSYKSTQREVRLARAPEKLLYSLADLWD